jgi:hypothetical protein
VYRIGAGLKKGHFTNEWLFCWLLFSVHVFEKS